MPDITHTRWLWALADQNGGEIEVSMDALNRAKRYVPIVEIEKKEDRMVIKRKDYTKVEIHAFKPQWPDESKIDEQVSKGE